MTTQDVCLPSSRSVSKAPDSDFPDFLCHFDVIVRGWSTVPCSPCPTDRTALRATTLPAIHCACASGATHRGYCAGRSQSGAWALTSYQWGLAWVGRKLGWVQGTDVTPFALDMSYPRTRVWRPGTAALSRPSWRRGNFHRWWPISTPLSPAREYTSSTDRPICCHR